MRSSNAATVLRHLLGLRKELGSPQPERQVSMGSPLPEKQVSMGSPQVKDNTSHVQVLGGTTGEASEAKEACAAPNSPEGDPMWNLDWSNISDGNMLQSFESDVSKGAEVGNDNDASNGAGEYLGNKSHASNETGEYVGNESDASNNPNVPTPMCRRRLDPDLGRPKGKEKLAGRGVGCTSSFAYMDILARDSNPVASSGDERSARKLDPHASPGFRGGHDVKESIEETNGLTPDVSHTQEPGKEVEDLQPLRLAAFRAVVKDSVEDLSKAIEGIRLSVWSTWENKAGKDLLTLAIERGSQRCHVHLSKALGLLIAAPVEEFSERESVWVFEPGRVQPRQATVIAIENNGDDSRISEASEVSIQVEFWDDDSPAVWVPRSSMRKTATSVH